MAGRARLIFRLVLATCGAVFLCVISLVFNLCFVDEPDYFDNETASNVMLSEPEELIPGSGSFGRMDFGLSNNNVDAIQHNGRFFVAFRTARFHFASDDARLIICSSADRVTWVQEAVFNIDDRDVREPQFLVMREQLLFYFFEARDNPLGFVPLSIRVSERKGGGVWSQSREVYKPGYGLWRIKKVGEEIYMSVHQGVRKYTDEGYPGTTRLLISSDGFVWRDVTNPDSVLIDFPCTVETDFDIDSSGALTAIVQVEQGRGSLLCRAPAGRHYQWDHVLLPNHYDMPLVFRHQGTIYMIARRSLGGVYDRGYRWLPEWLETWWYDIRFSLTRKRTALYKIIPEENRIVPVMDLPSRGDTSFPALVRLGENRYWLLNYSSDLDGPDWPWFFGQLTGSRIYEFELEFQK